MKALRITIADSDITAEDVKSLNLEKLEVGMLQNLYTLNHALFSQAGMEYERIGSFREILNKIEPIVFSDEEFNKLEFFDKVGLYKLLSSNLQSSLEFLQGLHAESAGGLNILNEIRKRKTEKPVEKFSSSADKAKLNNIKMLIESKIRERLAEKEEV
jgi:hypothetical protein